MGFWLDDDGDLHYRRPGSDGPGRFYSWTVERSHLDILGGA
jgi:hypothetical protein